MRRLLLLLLLLHFPTSCAHITVRPSTIASVAVICEFPRRYYTVDGSVTPNEEAALVDAIAQVNAVSPGLAAYGGRIEPLQAKETYEGGSTIVIGAPTRYSVQDDAALKLNKGVLAWTSMKTRPNTACLTGSVIAILVDEATWPEGFSHAAVISHEFLHSLGFGHADPQSALKTIMTPNIQKGVTGKMSAADLAAVRSTYFRGFF